MRRDLCVAALVAASGQVAFGTVFVADKFDQYNLGNIAGQGSWTAFGSAGLNPVQVVPDSPIPEDRAVALVQQPAAAEDVRVPLGRTMAAGNKWYAAFDVVVGAGVVNADYFAAFQWFTAAQLNVFPTKTGIIPSLSGGDFTFYIHQGSGTGNPASPSGTTQPWTSGFSFDTPHRLVLSYEFDTSNGELWVDPDPTLGEANPKIGVANPGGSAQVALEHFALRQSTVNTSTVRVDNLVVGDSFASVVKFPSPLAGDIDRDGDVDRVDLDVLLGNFGTTVGGGVAVGDLNIDGRVSADDLALFNLYFVQAQAAGAAAVPEPAAGLGMAALAVMVAGRRRR